MYGIKSISSRIAGRRELVMLWSKNKYYYNRGEIKLVIIWNKEYY